MNLVSSFGSVCTSLVDSQGCVCTREGDAVVSLCSARPRSRFNSQTSTGEQFFLYEESFEWRVGNGNAIETDEESSRFRPPRFTCIVLEAKRMLADAVNGSICSMEDSKYLRAR